MEKGKVILAYSGGLDTSVILKWLMNKGFHVICFVGNVGQKEDFEAIEKKALQTGASKVYVEDLREEFIVNYIYPALRANAAYEGRYLLGTTLSRPLLAKKLLEIAMKEKTSIVSHGATGKGNDQVRFELSCYALNPNIRCVTPWRDPEFISEFKGRTDLINYAQKWDIPVKASKKNHTARMKIYCTSAMRPEYSKILLIDLLKISFLCPCRLKMPRIGKQSLIFLLKAATLSRWLTRMTAQ